MVVVIRQVTNENGLVAGTTHEFEMLSIGGGTKAFNRESRPVRHSVRFPLWRSVLHIHFEVPQIIGVVVGAALYVSRVDEPPRRCPREIDQPIVGNDGRFVGSVPVTTFD